MSIVDISREWPAASFLSGVIFAVFLAVGLFFFKFWHKTREPFFFSFALAFWMLSFERIPLLLIERSHPEYSWIYLFRLIAFVLIIYSVIRANLAKSTKDPT